MIQFNTDNNIQGSEQRRAHFEPIISEQLSRFSDQVTRIEVHLTDENSHKQGINDIRCMLEARLEGMQPIAVTNLAADQHQAVKGAIDKLKSALDKRIGKLRTY